MIHLHSGFQALDVQLNIAATIVKIRQFSKLVDCGITSMWPNAPRSVMRLPTAERSATLWRRVLPSGIWCWCDADFFTAFGRPAE